MDSLEVTGQSAEAAHPRLSVEEQTATYARLVAEPLEAGYGITLGNALRRVLLSSLEGAAITRVRIDQVQHEFSTVQGMAEDVTEFLLNVKEIRLKPLTDREFATINLEVEGPAVVTAADLKVPPDFELVNPNLYLCRLETPGSRLSAEFDVESLHGRKGYRVASGEGVPPGKIPIDAIFTPIRKVNYRVEKTRVGQSTNFDRLILEVWTDGTIDPVEAVGVSAKILREQFDRFIQQTRPELAHAYHPALGSGAAGGLLMAPDRYNTPIEDLNLSVRAYNCLKRSGLMTVGQVLEKGEDELLGLRNFGRKSYDELRERLAELGYIDPDQPGLVPLVDQPARPGARAGRPAPAPARPAPRTSAVIMDDEEEDEENLSALGKALKEALLKDGSAEDLIGADDEE